MRRLPALWNHADGSALAKENWRPVPAPDGGEEWVDVSISAVGYFALRTKYLDTYRRRWYIGFAGGMKASTMYADGY